MRRHSLLSPSAAARWTACPASVKLASELPPLPPSAYAEEGTRAHAVAENAIRRYFGEPGIALPDEIASGGAIKSDAEMKSGAAFYVDAVRDLIGDRPGAVAHLVEVSLSIGEITGETDAVGTADLVIADEETLSVVDYKYGQGVKVEAVGNRQMLIYAAAAARLFSLAGGFKTVNLVIVQPRVGDGGTVSKWTIDAKQLDLRSTLFRPIRRAARRAIDLLNGAAIQDEDYGPSEAACRWCPAKGSCPKLEAEAVRALAETDAADNALADPEHLARAYRMVPAVRVWCEAVEKKVYDTLVSGGSVPGYKLVAGRAGIRKWGDPDAAEGELAARLGSAAYEEKLLSPAALEKLAKKALSPAYTDAWEAVKDMVVRPAPKPCVAPAEDKRPEWTENIIDCFED